MVTCGNTRRLHLLHQVPWCALFPKSNFPLVVALPDLKLSFLWWINMNQCECPLFKSFKSFLFPHSSQNYSQKYSHFAKIWRSSQQMSWDLTSLRYSAAQGDQWESLSCSQLMNGETIPARKKRRSQEICTSCKFMQHKHPCSILQAFLVQHLCSLNCFLDVAKTEMKDVLSTFLSCRRSTSKQSQILQLIFRFATS